MFWVVDNFLMRKKKKTTDEQDNVRAQFTRRVSTTNTAEEVEILLNNTEYADSEKLIHRESNSV